MTDSTSDGIENKSCCPPGSLGAPPPPDFSDPANKPRGTFLTLGDSNTPCYYTTGSSSSSQSSLGLVLFPDIWGFQTRIVLIADWLAERGGYHVIVCDPFRGETRDDHPDDLKGWLSTVPYRPVVADDTASCLTYLHDQHGVQAAAAVGFCWGAWAAGKACGHLDDNGVTAVATPPSPLLPWKAVVAPHPSFNIESWIFGGNDMDVMNRVLSTCPLLVLPAGGDPIYTKPGSDEFRLLQTVAAANNTTIRSIPFEDMPHGWTIRGDLEKDPAMKRNVEKALQEMLQFLQTHLG